MQCSSQIVITNKPTSSFLQARCPSCRPTNSVTAPKGKVLHYVSGLEMCVLMEKSALVRHIVEMHWRRNRGFRRFNEPRPQSSWGPEYWGHRKISGKTLRKINKNVSTRSRILRLNCTKFDFGWGSAPDPAGELTASCI